MALPTSPPVNRLGWNLQECLLFEFMLKAPLHRLQVNWPLITAMRLIVAALLPRGTKAGLLKKVIIIDRRNSITEVKVRQSDSNSEPVKFKA